MRLKGVDFINLYIGWLKSNIKTADINDYIEITTPFLDRHNDYLQIYVKQKNNKFIISDDSYIISDLIMSGCDLNSLKRRSVLNGILSGFGVKMKDDELYVEANIDNFAQKKHLLMQAMLSVNDMFMLSQHKVASIFLEDIYQFLKENDIRFTSSIQLYGRSGFTHMFDFLIPASKVKPERLIKAINNPNKQKAETVLFSWADIKEVRKDETSIYVFLNDYEKEIKSDILNAFSEYDINPVFWSQREKHINELAS